jgi:hypothetical protein
MSALSKWMGGLTCLRTLYSVNSYQEYDFMWHASVMPPSSITTMLTVYAVNLHRVYPSHLRNRPQITQLDPPKPYQRK